MKHLRRRTYGHISIWIGAGIVGIAAVLYARLIDFAQRLYLKSFDSHSIWFSIFTPLLFLLATALVRKVAPDAKGSGIPQVLEAIEQADRGNASVRSWSSSLVSLRTAVVKVLSSTVGVLAGASIGREGPTVQIAASGFAWVARVSRRWLPDLSFSSYLVAGAAAGVAAAFNTPLAGITFAIEELADGAFGPFRQTVMLSVIIAGVTAQALLGDYLYFGHPVVAKPTFVLFPEAVFLGLLAGGAGGVFSKLLAYPRLTRLPLNWWPRALACGIICAIIGYFTSGATAGSGYEVTRNALGLSSLDGVDIFFPIWKLCTTVLSYLSGMAGGIFSPSLSIGAGIGISFAKLAHLSNFKTCALIGMVAFFSGAVQAPLTAVIIVTEMTDEHILIIPFMIAAFIGHGSGKLLMPVPLYRYLAQRNIEG